MKKLIFIFALLCCVLFALSGCTTKYKRISLNSSETLGEELNQHIDKATSIVNTANEKFPNQLPIYKISERKISKEEFQQMIKQLGIDYSKRLHLEENKISGDVKYEASTAVGEFNMTDEELEKLAWDTFNKLPFIEGDYEYFGITETITTHNSKGTHIDSVGVSFRRVLDGVRVIGEDRCNLYFDNAGLMEVYIKLYNYEKIGTMDLMPLESASSKLKKPDAFQIFTEPLEPKLGMVDTLQIKQINLLLVNQYSRECTILQPVYSYNGTATDVNDKQEEFNSKIIAIPEAYTYESDDESE